MDDGIAELSRLRAFAIRVGPIVAAAVELRELGRSLERIEEYMESRDRDDYGTRSGTPWLIVKQAYETALLQFDEAVKAAGLGNFADLLGGIYQASQPIATAPSASAPPPVPKEPEPAADR